MKKLILFTVLVLVISIFHSPLSAQIYPTNVTLTIQIQEEMIDQEEVFEIIDMEEYILLPLVSLSRWLDLDINYLRENELLTAYYQETNRNIQIDLNNEIYYEHPEWSAEPPIIIEGDFYVTIKLIEYLTDAKIEWLPRQQEVILTFDYKKEADSKIKMRPKDYEIKPEVSDKDFSLGSIHYKLGFDYEFEDDTNESSLLFNNLMTIHGRAVNWTYSIEQELKYDYEIEKYEINYPYLSAKNSNNNRLIILGDNRFSLSNTLNRVDLRGIYLQYPLQQISEKRAYTSVKGKADEGSTVILYANEKKIEEQYIYQGENSYYFENIPLILNRTNVIRILIVDVFGKETEIVKKVAGSLYIFEEDTNEGVFAAGRSNKNDELDTFFNIGGVQIKYAPSANTSLFWELGVERNDNGLKGNYFTGGSMARIALRSKDLPLIFYLDWLAGGEVDLVEHGVRASTFYTIEDGYINVSYEYVPPQVADNLKVEEGQQIKSLYEKELNENWLMNIELQNTKSILSMDELDLNSIELSFDYADKARNSFTIGTEIANRTKVVNWSNLSLIEQSQQSYDINLKGKTYRNLTTLGGEVSYNLANINFYNETEDTITKKQKDYTSLDLDISRNLTDNTTLIGNYETEFTFIEKTLFERESEVVLKARVKTGNYTSIIASISNKDEYNENQSGDVNTERRQQLEVFMNYNVPRSVNVSAGIKNTYLKEDSYLSGEFNVDYDNPKSDWKVGFQYDYTGPYGSRMSAQEEINIELSRYILAGLEGFLSLERSYDSSSSEEPIYIASISFSQALGFVNGDVQFQKYNGREHRSTIAGLVYLDENGNQNRDPNEPLLEGISIFNDNKRTQTDNKGYFIFENVRRGLHNIGFYLNELTDNYQIVTDDKRVELRENENLFLEFGLTQMGEIQGQIHLQKFEYGDRSYENIPLNHIGIRLVELNRIAFTKSDGSFIFQDLPLGEYSVQVMESSLPNEITVKGENKYEAKIKTENLINKEIKIILISN